MARAALTIAIAVAAIATVFESDLVVVVLALIGARVALLIADVCRRTLPWTRLLLPSIVIVSVFGGAGIKLAVGGVLELAFVVVAIRELRRSSTELLETRIARAFTTLLPERFARLIAFELVLIGSALRFLVGGWRRPCPPGFTYHRESGLRLFLAVLPLLAVGDVLLLELVILRQAETWVRIVVHAISIYSLLWIVGLYATCRARPHRIGERVTLYRGLLRRVELAREDIASVEPIPAFADDWKQRAYCKGAIRIDVSGATVLELRLHRAVRPIGPIGEGAPATRVLISADDAAQTIAALRL